MLKFTINMKELKPIVDKISTVIDKNSRIPASRRCYFHITDDQKLRVYATDWNHFLEIECDAAHGIECGKIGIDIDDLKIITKMTGEVTVMETTANKKSAVTVRSHGKCMTLPGHFEDGMDLPEMENADQAVLLDSSWLLETVTKLSSFTMKNVANPLSGCICLNTQTKQAEALDGHHAGMRRIPENASIYWEGEIKLPHYSFSVLKTILDKTPGKDVLVSRDGKYIKISGQGFTYIARQVDGKFFDMNRALKEAVHNAPYRITAEREEFIKIIQYASSLIKKDKTSLILHGANERLFSYLNTGQYEILDEISTGKAELPEKFFIGFSPCQLLNILKVLDTKTIELHVGNEKSIAYVKEREYDFLICPTCIIPEDKKAAEKLILTGFTCDSV